MADPAARPGGGAEVAGLSALGADAGPLLIAVGVFDGLHRGHVYLIRHLRREARRGGARPAVITFDAHPDEVLLGAAPPILCDPAERLIRLARLGVEITIVQHFDETLRRTPFEAFVAMIRERTELAGFVMTPDAAFGNERRGTPEALGALGAREHFRVTVVPPLEIGGRQVRSSEIRAAIRAGELAAARELLGRRFAVVGERGSGRESGSVRFHLPVALPPSGVYPVSVEPAWSDTGSSARWRRTARAEVSDDRRGTSITLRSRFGLPPGERIRIAF